MKHNRDEGITLGSLDVVRERLERQARAALGEEGYEAAGRHARDRGTQHSAMKACRGLLGGLMAKKRAQGCISWERGYEAAVRAGEALSRDDAIELALSPIDSSPTPDEQAPTG